MVAVGGVWEHDVIAPPVPTPPVPTPPGTRAPPRPRLTRSADRRLVGGVAAGVADHLGVDPLVVRLAFVVLTAASGAGLVFYVVAWLVLPQRDAPQSIAQRAMLDRRSAGQALSIGLIVLGVLLAVRSVGIWFDDSVVWPLSLAAAGLAVIWRQAGDDERATLLRLAGRLPPAGPGRGEGIAPMGRAGLLRVGAGVVLVAGGVGIFLAAHGAFSAVGPALVATAVIAGGFAVVFAPWWWRLGKELAAERRERVRNQERAEVAAHLHDSVLQTLALIQRHAADPPAVQRLARRQEAELRSWLYGRPAAGAADSVSAAIEAAAREVEDLHGVVVDVVAVGDGPLDERLAALVAAAKEGMVNAAKWSGEGLVSVYAETEPERVTVYVRDRGRGFDVDAVGADRHGIADSIVGRMARHAGTATVRSSPEGTEVGLEMQRVAE